MESNFRLESNGAAMVNVLCRLLRCEVVGSALLCGIGGGAIMARRGAGEAKLVLKRLLLMCLQMGRRTLFCVVQRKNMESGPIE